MTQPSTPTRLTRLRLLVLATTGLCLLAVGVRAAVPLRIEYQGIVNDAGGQPFTGIVTIGLSLWDNATLGAQIFSETHAGVSVVGGRFTVEIGGGSGDTLDTALFEDPNRWVEISVNGNLLVPRQRLLSVPYALLRSSLPASECAAPFKLLGLTAAGGLLCGDPSGGGMPFSMEPGEDVGTGSSIAIASDGFPVISYFHGGSNQDLRVIHCKNRSCSSVEPPVTLDGVGIVGRRTSIAIGVDGFPAISYSDETNGALKFLHCTNLECSSVDSPITLDSSGTTGAYSSLAIGSDGFPVISYIHGDAVDHELSIVHCTSIDCTSNDAPITLSIGQRPVASTIAIGTDSFPVVSYFDYTSNDLMFVHCSSVSCASFDTPLALDSNGSIGEGSSIAIGADGFPVISYSDFDGGLWVLHCTTTECLTSDSPTNVDIVADGSPTTSIAIGIDGFPVISYLDPVGFIQKLVHCKDPVCTTFDSPVILEDSVVVEKYSSIAIGVHGFPIVSYRDVTNSELKVISCRRPDCAGF